MPAKDKLKENETAANQGKEKNKNQQAAEDLVTHPLGPAIHKSMEEEIVSNRW